MERHLCFHVPAAFNGKSAQTFLQAQHGFSTGLIRKIKKDPNGLRINGKPAYFTQRVCTADQIEIIVEKGDENSDSILPCAGSLSIIYEDADLLILDKPAGIATHPSQHNRDRSVAGQVMRYYHAQGKNFVFRCVTRLDKGTTGLMVIAKNAYANERLIEQLHSSMFIREYLALAAGVLNGSGVIDAPIARCADSVIKRCVDKKGDCAVTHYRVIAQDGEKTLVRLRLETGRTHQIRVHMAHIGHPLSGDFLYGEERADFPRPALHSAYIALHHPVTGALMEWTSPLPEDMQAVFRQIDTNAID